MGAWGLGLFQSDYDLDILDALSEDAGVDSLYVPKSVRKARRILDSGSLVKMVTTRMPDAANSVEKGDWSGYELVILGAAAMQVGAKLPSDLREFMEKNYRKVGLMRDALTQMEKGLAEYQNGTPYDFGSKGLHETMMSGGPDFEDRISPGMINVPSPGPGNFMAEIMRKMSRNLRGENNAPNQAQNMTAIGSGEPAASIVHPADSCGNCGAKSGIDTNSGPLLKCGGCGTQLYCGKSCQKKHWKVHKKTCKSPST